MAGGRGLSEELRKSKEFNDELTRLGQRVRELRLEREWTLEAAAAKMGLDLKHLQKIEAASKSVGDKGMNPTLVTLYRLAKGFDMPIAELFSYTNDD